MADNLLILLQNQDKWPAMGIEGRRHVENNYNIVHEAAKLEAIYKRFINA